MWFKVKISTDFSVFQHFKSFKFKYIAPVYTASKLQRSFNIELYLRGDKMMFFYKKKCKSLVFDFCHDVNSELFVSVRFKKKHCDHLMRLNSRPKRIHFLQVSRIKNKNSWKSINFVSCKLHKLKNKIKCTTLSKIIIQDDIKHLLLDAEIFISL